MAIPLLAAGLSALFRRYGLKGLSAVGKKALRAKTRGKFAESGAKKVTREQFNKKGKSIRRREVAGNVLGDGLGALAIGDAVSSAIDINKFKSKKELRDYIKMNKPRVWKDYSDSGFTDIEEYLKSRKANA